MNYLDLLIWAQNPRFGPRPGPGFGPGPGPGFGPSAGTSSGADPGAAIALFLAMYACFFFVMFLMSLVVLAGVWKAFVKAGEPGWAAIVPVYNMMVMARIAGKDEMYGLLTLLPFVGIIFSILILLDFCKRYDVGDAFVIGLILLPVIFWPMLGFGSARFRGQPRARRRRTVDDEEDYARPRSRRYEDEDDRPRRRYADDEEDDRPRRRGDSRVRRPRDED